MSYQMAGGYNESKERYESQITWRYPKSKDRCDHAFMRSASDQPRWWICVRCGTVTMAQMELPWTI